MVVVVVVMVVAVVEVMPRTGCPAGRASPSGWFEDTSLIMHNCVAVWHASRIMQD